MKTLGKILLFSLIALFSMAMQNDKPAYIIFDKEASVVSYNQLLEKALDADIVFFGELHDNPICHWLELELTKDLATKNKGKVVLGAEMFETDNQLIINEYLNGQCYEKNFEEEAKLWNNYTTDYKPLLELAKSENLQFIATNIPRRYAALVHKRGFEALDSLDSKAKELIAPLPIPYYPELPCYKNMLSMGRMPMPKIKISENLPKAQASKDATMAYFIGKHLKNGHVFIHFNGAYHSDNYEGIVHYLKQSFPKLKILTISSVAQEDMSQLSGENKGKADFIIVTPLSMTSTY